jgi:hypothetical protein
MIGLDVKADDGSTEKWSVGGPSTTRMEANGWDKTTLKPGDAITAPASVHRRAEDPAAGQDRDGQR